MATDNAVIRRDGTVAGLLQESSATIDDSGTINIPSGQTYDINGSAHAHTYAEITAADGGTDVTAAELEELSDGSETTLHSHAAGGGDWVLIEHLDKDAGAGASFDFTSISGSYTHLMIVCGTRTSDATSRKLNMTFNGDTAGNYTWRNENRLGTANGTSASFLSIIDLPDSGDTAERLAVVRIFIPHYVNTNWDKEFFSEGYDPVNDVRGSAYGNWNSTSAITQVTLSPAVGNHVQYSYADLYGIN